MDPDETVLYRFDIYRGDLFRYAFPAWKVSSVAFGGNAWGTAT